MKRIKTVLLQLPWLSLWLLAGCGGEATDPVASLDPSLGDRPVVYVQRTVPRDPDSGALMPHRLAEPAAFHGGARLVLRASASPGAGERIITAGLFDGPYDVRDLSISADGMRLLFALRAPEDPDLDDDEQPTWNIWEYRFATGALRRVISNDLVAEEGQDLAPRYLPDGRILFASTRQRQARARLLDEGKPQFAPLDEEQESEALALHLMQDDGTDIRQISFNMSHDLSPVVGPQGRVLFTRWDGKWQHNAFNLYRMRPDGLEEEVLYGADSHDRGNADVQFELLDRLPDDRLLVSLRQEESLYWSGTPAAINVQDFVNLDTPVSGRVTGGLAEQLLADFGLAQGNAQAVARNGRVGAVAPLGDGSNRLMVAWSPCRLALGGSLRACTADNLAAGGREAPPSHGLWVFDLDRGTRLPVVPPGSGRMITDVAVATPRPAPAVINDALPGSALEQTGVDEQSGIIDIRSVYDVDGAFNPWMTPPAGVTTLADFRDPALVTAPQRRVAFLRILRGVRVPGENVVDLDNSAFGRSPALGMSEIIGYLPVEPDGSVRARVPANIPLSLQLVDRQGRAIAAPHGSWITVRPGQELECTGCHQTGSAAPHGRPGAQPASVNDGAPQTGQPFPNTQPGLFADAGETMAQVRTRLDADALLPSLEMVYTDVWTDPAVRTPDPDWALLYDDLETAVPATNDCRQDWDRLCSITIHYPTHVQPIWDLPRDVMQGGSLVDGTCSTCHSRRDAMDNLQVPPAQLELTGEASSDDPDQFTGYRELLFGDNALALENGALVDAQQPATDGAGNIIYQTDEEGNLILDAQGDPVPVMETIPVAASMVAGRARAGSFFDVFDTGGAHEGWLSAAELRLLAEWLDGGGQYYNDPFVVPQ